MVSERNSYDKPFRDHSSALDKALDRYRKGLICLEFSEFNQPINMWEWEVSKGKSFNGMFWSTQFIQPISVGWIFPPLDYLKLLRSELATTILQ
jgi:hypothetical protein